MKTPHESLWQYILALPFSLEGQMFWGMFGAALFGMVLHYVRARASNAITDNPISYFFQHNVWRSLGAIVAVGLEVFGEVGSGIFTTDTGYFVGWGIVLISGFKTGYLGDSLINKGTRPQLEQGAVK